MELTNVIIPTDSELERNFNDFCEDMGMSMQTAINIFMKKAVREYKMPFEIGGDIPNDETLEAIKEAEEIISHPESVKGYKDVDEMMKDILG